MTAAHDSDALRVLFAGGGTGGHLMPGAATADALRALVPDAQSLFLMTDRRAERSCLHALAGCRTARTTDLRWEGPAGKALWPGRAALALARTLDVLRGFRPHVVVGLGGVNSIMPVSAARLLGMRTAAFESNVTPGRAVRAMAPFCDCVMLHWPQAAALLHARRVAVTGSPIRRGLMACDRQAAQRRLGLTAGRPTLLAVGGSQGALALNDALFAALRRVRAQGLDLQVLHLTGLDLLHSALERAERAGLTGYRAIGFMERMADAYAVADVVLARAGGSTLAELTALGLPAILVPYPHATDGHQSANAQAAAAAGAALVIPQAELSDERLAGAILQVVRDEARRARMARCARRIGRPAAAFEVAARLAALGGFVPQTVSTPTTEQTTIRKPLQAA
jgi:UDP-N-acetylglucosamine--N-acetylmuramyl-(pentapeptide) pyrophosphoryl-undecaprenol N-acetylglucosamine transferase